MNWRAAIVDKSPHQKRLRVELARIELKPLGYSVVRSDWLAEAYKRIPVAERFEAMAEAVR